LARRFGGGEAGAGGTGNGGTGNGGSGNGGSGGGSGNGGSGNGGSGGGGSGNGGSGNGGSGGGSGNGGATTGRGPGGPSGGGSVGPLPGETAIGSEPGPEQAGFDPFGGLLSGIFGGPTIPAAAAEPNLPSNTITQTTESATFNVTDPSDVHETTYTLNKQKTVDAALAHAIQESMIAYPEAWAESTGTTNVQHQFEQVTGIKFPTIFTDGTNGSAPDDPDYEGLNGLTVEGADVPGVDYFASALEFFENLLGGKKEELDTVDEKDLPIEPQINPGDLVGPGPNPGPGPDALEVLYDPDRCTRIARTLLADTNVSSDFKNKAKWYLGSNLQCDTFFNDVSYAANLNQITGLTQRQIQLEALGLASEDITRSLAEEANVRESQRSEDIDYITEVNTRLSGSVVDLGNAALDLQQQIADLANAEKEGCAWFDIPCQIGEAGRAAAIPVLVIGGGILAAWLLLRRR